MTVSPTATWLASSNSAARRLASTISESAQMQQTWTVLQYVGPDHLGLCSNQVMRALTSSGPGGGARKTGKAPQTQSNRSEAEQVQPTEPTEPRNPDCPDFTPHLTLLH